MIKILLYIFIIFLFLFLSSAKASYPEHNFGLNLSLSNGMGLSYKIDLSRKYSALATGFAYYSGDNPSEDLTMYVNLGTELQYNIYESESIDKFYISLGASIWKIEDKKTIKYLENDIQKSKLEIKRDLISNIALSSGVNYNFSESVHIATSLGIMLQNSDSPKFNTLIDRKTGSGICIAPTLSFGIYFKL